MGVADERVRPRIPAQRSWAVQTETQQPCVRHCGQVAGSLDSVLPEATQICIHGGGEGVRMQGAEGDGGRRDAACTLKIFIMCVRDTTEGVLSGLVPLLWHMGDGGRRVRGRRAGSWSER